MKRYNHFTYDQIQGWRAIPLWLVVSVANACHKGSNYNKCSKSDIYDSFDNARYNGSTHADYKLFAEIMTHVVSPSCRHEERFHREMNNLIKEYTKP